jgi:hypothetical protein
VLGHRGQECAHDEALERHDHGVSSLGDRPELSGWRHVRRIGPLVTLLNRVLQSGDADHEEFVEIRRDDGRELYPFEERVRGIRRLLEYPLVECQPG